MAFKDASRTKHNTHSRRSGDLTIGYSADLRLPSLGFIGPKWGFHYAGLEAAWAYAKKHGWVIRNLPKGGVKVMDIKTGNVTFSNETKRAVYGMIKTLGYCKEYRLALLRAMY